MHGMKNLKFMCIALHYNVVIVFETRTKRGLIKRFLESLQEIRNSGALSVSP